MKKVVFVNFDVYSIGHDMKDLPPATSRPSSTWTRTSASPGACSATSSTRDQHALSDAFAMNNYSDASKIGPFVAAFSGDLVKGAAVTIQYSSAAKTVSVNVQGGGTATVPGVDFMKAVWSIWFAKIDQPSLGDALIKNL